MKCRKYKGSIAVKSDVRVDLYAAMLMISMGPKELVKARRKVGGKSLKFTIDFSVSRKEKLYKVSRK